MSGIVRITEPEEKKHAPVWNAKGPSVGSPLKSISALQRSIGNRAVQRLLKSGALQTKAKISSPGDICEVEAEKVAEEVVRMPEPVGGQWKNHSEGLLTGKGTLTGRSEGRQTPMDKGGLRRKAVSHSNEKGSGISAAGKVVRGAGEPLSGPLRSYFEPRFGNDFGGVRVHMGAEAAEAARAVKARAFTVGRDVVFGEGEFAPDTGEGKRLLAHELTHVVQNNGHAQGEFIQRAKKAEAVETDAEKGNPEEAGAVNDENKTITFQSIKLPDFKASAETGHNLKQYFDKRISANMLLRARGYKRGNPSQDAVWDKSISEESLEKKLITRLGGAYTSTEAPYALKHAKSGYYIIGKLNDLVQASKRPAWDRMGEAKPKDVDHIVELQMSGWDRDPWPNTAGKDGNMELMDSVANQDSGRKIMREIIRKIQVTREYWPGLEDEQDPKKEKKAPSVNKIKKDYDIVFKGVEKGLGQSGDPKNNYWTWQEISEDTKHLDEFQPAEGGPGGNKWMIFPSARGGEPKVVEGGKRAPTAEDKNWLSPFLITAIDLKMPSEKGADIGTVTLDLGDNAKKLLKFSAMPVNIKRLESITNSGYLDNEKVMSVWRRAKLKSLSPIEISSWDILPDKGFVAYGTILPDVPLFKKASIDLAVEGEKIELRKVFDTGDFSMPGPFQVTSSSLEVFAGTAGVGVRGLALFEVDRLGSGRIGATTSVNLSGDGSLELEGEFNFDTELFDPAKVKVWYRSGKFGGLGELGVKEGKVRGIRSANVTASFEQDRIKASGNVKPDIPGIEQGEMTLDYSPAAGLLIGATLELKKDIPGIRGGSLKATVEKKASEKGYRVSASGTAVPKIPGVNTVLNASYDDGAFTIEGTADYEKGMLKGSVLIGATNLPVDGKGKSEDKPAEKTGPLRAYGGGSVTVRIAPWLQGTVGIKLLSNGEMEVSGAIGLPAALNIFPEKRYDKNIFTIGLDIPIVGVAVAGQRIGIFANISGGLDLSAGIGPGQLQELGLSITYNPAHEDQTRVKGGGKLYIPAQAGLRLFVRGGIGAGIPVVSAQAGLEIGGSLGLEGAVEAGVQIDWTPAKGLKLDAFGQIYAEPKFKFDISGFVLVEADLVLTTIELYNKKWQFAAFEYGSGLRFGVKFPIHYEEGKPFDISLSDMQFEVPTIDKKELLEGLMKKIV